MVAVTPLRTGSSALVLVLALAACRTFDAPPPALVATVEASASPVEGAVVGSVSVESERLGGDFEAVLVRRGGSAPAARLQLFGDLGGAVLDVAVTPRRVAGHFPYANVGLAHELADGALPRHLITFLAASLLESATPIEGRVMGSRETDAGHELRLRPSLPGLDVVATVDASGVLRGREYELRHVRWRESIDYSEAGVPLPTFEGRGFRMRITDAAAEEPFAPGELTDDLFHLELPESSLR